MADAACGVVLGAGFWPGGAAPWLQIAGALGVYTGGMALNDWADRAEDAAVRPDRPIPSGAISPGSALGLGVLLMVGGVAASFAADRAAGLLMAAVAVAAFVYDVAGRGPWRGPLLLAFCRAGNLGAAALLGARAAGADGRLVAIPALLYGTYVFLVSRLGRMEDTEDAAELGSRPTRLLLAAGACLLAAAVLPWNDAWPNLFARSLLACAAAFSLWRGAHVFVPWTRGRVMQSMGLALRRLLVFPVLFAWSASGAAGLVVGALALLGWPISAALRRVFPPS